MLDCNDPRLGKPPPLTGHVSKFMDELLPSLLVIVPRVKGTNVINKSPKHGLTGIPWEYPALKRSFVSWSSGLEASSASQGGGLSPRPHHLHSFALISSSRFNEVFPSATARINVPCILFLWTVSFPLSLSPTTSRSMKCYHLVLRSCFHNCSPLCS